MMRDMSKRLHNWNYHNVTDFLNENGFTFYREVGGSHQAWIKSGDLEVEDRIVGLHFTHGSYNLGAMKRMIYASGIDEAEWLKWGSS